MGKRILIIDDDPAYREMVGIALKESIPDIEIHEARDGHLGEKMLRQTAYDLIMLDYKLPFGMDGLRFLEKTEGLRLSTPLLMVTGEGSENVAARAFRLGVTDYLVKNNNLLNQLQSVVQEILAEGTRHGNGPGEQGTRRRASLNTASSSVEFIRNYQEEMQTEAAGVGQMGDAVMIEFENADEFNRFSSYVKRIDGVRIQDVRVLGGKFIFLLSLLPTRFEKMGKVFTTG